MKPKSFDWPPPSVRLLRKLWGEDKTAAEIAARIGSNVSRAAVIGKAHRLGLPGRPSPIKRKEKPMQHQASTKTAQTVRRVVSFNANPVRPKPDLKQILQAPEPKKLEGKPLPLVDIGPTQCRFAVTPDHAVTHLFCGRATAPGSCYCQAHHAIAYVSKRPAETEVEEKAA